MDLSKHLEKADEAVRRRNYPFAVDIYHKLLAMQPDSGEARAGLRRALFKKAEAKTPSRLGAILGGGVHLVTAHVCRLLGQHGAAAKAFERYLTLDPLDEGANVGLGNALERAGLRRSALAVFQAYAEAQPRCLEASRSAGALLYEAGRHDEAMAMYEQALKVNPRDQESLKARKNLAAEGALRRTGLERAGSSREVMKDRASHQELEREGRLQLSGEEVEQELGELEAKLAESPDDPKLLGRVADLRLMEDDLQGAVDCLERALTLRPDDIDLAEKVGDLRLRIQEKQVEEAAARGDAAAADRARTALAEAKAGEYRRRVERNPTDLGLRFHLGSALLALGRHDEAIAELQQAVKDPRKKAESLLLLGRAFRAKDLGELALGQLEKALQATGGTGDLGKEVLYEMGALSEVLGQTEAAIRSFSRILEQDIGFRDVAQRVQELKSKA